jgi:hypothetical protein
MIAIARSWGVPARYVSGYLYHRRQDKDRSGEDATHAWIEAYLPSFGWIGFDPTNNIMTGERHIRVAVGRDYDDVPPTRGTFKGGAESELGVAVAVEPTSAPVRHEEFLRVARPMSVTQERSAPPSRITSSNSSNSSSSTAYPIAGSWGLCLSDRESPGRPALGRAEFPRNAFDAAGRKTLLMATWR